MTIRKSVFLIYLSPTQLPAAPGSIPSIPEIQLKNVDVTEVNQRHCLEERYQWLENGYQTHLSSTG